MGHRDHNFDYKLQGHSIRAECFGPFALSLTLSEGVPNTVDTLTIDNLTTALVLLEDSDAAGNAVGEPGWKMNTAGQLVNYFEALAARSIDWQNDVYVRVVYSTQSATTADTIDWKVLYDVKPYGSAAVAAPATALDTVIAQDTVAGASIRQATAWGVISGGTVDPTPGTSDYIGFQVEMDAKAAGLDEDIFFLELEFAYLPDLCIGLPAKRVNAPTAA